MNSLNYLDRIRQKPSCVDFAEPAEPHHLLAIGMGNNRKDHSEKHYSSIPLTRYQHTLLHQRGRIAFEQMYHINLWQEAFKLLLEYTLELEDE